MTELSTVAALVGDPARARIVTALLDGRALTATELALAADIAPSTASSHLDRLCRGGILVRAAQGRHRYFRLASVDVAMALEGLLAVAEVASPASVRTGPRDAALRAARVCYDHLAGQAGVALFDALEAKQYLQGVALTEDGARWAASLGIDVPSLTRGARPLVRRCLDWSERRDHVAGAIGAALLERFIARRWMRRETRGRALVVSSSFHQFLAALRM